MAKHAIGATFTALWSAYTLSAFGSAITTVALPVLAAVELSAGPLQMGMIGAARTLPFALLAPLAGVMADRLPRRGMLVAADLFRALVLFTVPVAAAFDVLTVPLLYVVSAGIGIGDVWSDVAQSSFLPTVVAPQRLVEAHRRLGISQSTADVAGPSIAGELIKVLGAPLAILTDAVSYLCSATMLLFIRSDEPKARAADAGARIGQQILEGARFVLRHAMLRPLTLRLTLWHFIVGGVYSMLVLYMTTQMRLDAPSVGRLLSVSAAGVLAGALFSRMASERFGMGPVIVATNVGAASAAVLVPIATGNGAFSIAIMGGALFLYGICVVNYQVNNASLRQLSTPVSLLGRMHATTRSLSFAGNATGALSMGLLAQALGLRWAVGMYAVLGLTLSLLGTRSAALMSVRQLPVEVARQPS